MRERVVRARKLQIDRFAGEKKIYANAQMPPKLIRKHCAISAEGEKLLENRHHSGWVFPRAPTTGF